MPARKKAPTSASLKEPSTVLYFSLGALAAALVGGLVALLRRRATSIAAERGNREPQTGRVMTPPAEEYPAAKAKIPGESSTQAQNEEAGQLASESPSPAAATLAGPEADTRWSVPTKYIVGISLGIGILFAVYVARGVLNMIVFAALLAFVLQPVIEYLARRTRMRRGAATGVIYLVVVVLIILIPFLVVPALINAFNTLTDIVYQRLMQSAAAALQSAANELSAGSILSSLLGHLLGQASQLLSGLSAGAVPQHLDGAAAFQTLTESLGKSIGIVANVLGAFISGIVWIVFALLIAIRMNLAGDSLRTSVMSLVPDAFKPEIEGLMGRLSEIWNSFLRGEITLMLAVGVAVWLGNTLIGTPEALALGVLAGLLEVVPNIGPILAAIPAVFLALAFGSEVFTAMSHGIFALIVILLYSLIQFLENQVFVPRILGDAVSLHPLVVIIGVTIFGSAFGLLGVLLATPTIATLGELYAYLYRKILEGPAPPPAETKPSLLETVRGLARRIRLPWRRGPRSEGATEVPPAANAE